MHKWGNKDVDWQGIYEAARYIGEYQMRYGRTSVLDMKEKYGEARVYVHFGWSTGWLMNHLFYPGYHYYQFPNWVRKIDEWVPCSWINPLLIPYQERLYRRAYKNALKKWPHLRNEILNGADYEELLRGL
jgi:hypothetical protein